MNNAYTTEIDAPPAKVFRWIYEADRNLQWLPNIVEAEVLTREPGHVGSTFRQVYVENGRRMEMTGTVTAYEQDRRVASHLKGPFDLYVDYRLEDLGGRTRLTLHSEVRTNGAMTKIVGTLLRPMMRKMAMKNYETSSGNLKRCIAADLS
jgi:uncharacterized protein YndB with AHSA1/START domain